MKRRDYGLERARRSQARSLARQYGLPWPGVDEWVAQAPPSIEHDTWLWS